MTNTIYAKKIGMTEGYVGDTRHSVTVLQLMPMTVVSHKSTEKDGYASTQVIFGTAPKKTTKSLAGHLKKSNVAGKYIREIPVLSDLAAGSMVNYDDMIKPGTIIDISGISKGKGLAGVVKRWNFAGGPRTHGQSDRLRRAGSIGQGTTPGRVYKGKHMSGRMGNDSVTIKNTSILSFDPNTLKIIVSGSVPGSNGNIVKLVKRGDAPSTFPVVTLTKLNKVVVTPASAAVESETV